MWVLVLEDAAPGSKLLLLTSRGYGWGVGDEDEDEVGGDRE